jgi:hypothetical protein
LLFLGGIVDGVVNQGLGQVSILSGPQEQGKRNQEGTELQKVETGFHGLTIRGGGQERKEAATGTDVMKLKERV